ncbi:hypothetical protein Tco_1299804, partial [Tanacetum coccineum]
MINGDPSGSAVLVNNLDAGNPLHMNPNDSTMSSDVYMGLVYSVDAASMWKELESTYDKVDGSVIDAWQRLGHVVIGQVLKSTILPGYSILV